MIPETQESLPQVVERFRIAAPAPAPQALAWHGDMLWVGSRDRRTVHTINVSTGAARQQDNPPGIPWAAVSTDDAIRFTIGEGDDDDRYVWQYKPGCGFSASSRMACPELTGSYLSYDGEHVYLSQWYKHRILKLDGSGQVVRTIDIGAEISGHTFVNGRLYVVRGTEQAGEKWRLARVDHEEETPTIRDLALIPFASRSLTFDGHNFWSNYRANNEIIGFGIVNGSA